MHNDSLCPYLVVFAQKRLFIVVTCLDEYKLSQNEYNDDSYCCQDSDDDDAVSLEDLICNIKLTVKKQCEKFGTIPDDCIVPVSANGALEARKEKKSKGLEAVLLNFRKLQMQFKDEDLDTISQVPLLEER